MILHFVHDTHPFCFVRNETLSQVRLDRTATSSTAASVTPAAKPSPSSAVPTGTGRASSRLQAIREKNKARVILLLPFLLSLRWANSRVTIMGENRVVFLIAVVSDSLVSPRSNVLIVVPYMYFFGAGPKRDSGCWEDVSTPTTSSFGRLVRGFVCSGWGFNTTRAHPSGQPGIPRFHGKCWQRRRVRCVDDVYDRPLLNCSAGPFDDCVSFLYMWVYDCCFLSILRTDLK